MCKVNKKIFCKPDRQANNKKTADVSLCRKERPQLFSEVVLLPSYSLFCHSKTQGVIFEAGLKQTLYLGQKSEVISPLRFLTSRCWSHTHTFTLLYLVWPVKCKLSLIQNGRKKIKSLLHRSPLLGSFLPITSPCSWKSYCSLRVSNLILASGIKADCKLII